MPLLSQRSEKQRKAIFAKMAAGRQGPLRRRSRTGLRRPQKLTAAQQRLAVDNQKLIHHFAKRYRERGVAYDDLVGEGQLGLLAAARLYQKGKGKFSTYASKDIEAHIRRALGKGRTVRVPEKRLKAAKAAGPLPTAVSLEALTQGSEGGISRAHARATLSRLRKRANKLSAGPRQVFIKRFWSNGEPRPEPWTLRQVSKSLKLPLTRVYRLQIQAKQKLGIT